VKNRDTCGSYFTHPPLDFRDIPRQQDCESLHESPFTCYPIATASATRPRRLHPGNSRKRASILLAEVIAIGDELTSGQRLDTNSQWLSQQLGELGIQTTRHTTIGDDLAMNIAVVREAAARADFIVCTGGLGPTQDDLTRQAMADAFGRQLILDEPSLEHIRRLFAKRQREMPERNRIQAMFPAGAKVIPNPHGSAPGIDLLIDRAELNREETGNCRLFALPGVPAELKQMWQETVQPSIEQAMSGDLGPLHYQAIKVFGIGESDVEAKLPGLIDRQRRPTVGITVSRATITLRIVGRAKTRGDFEQLVAPTVREIHAALGDLVFGEGDDELEHVVLRQLRDSRRTIACVELGSASWLSDWFLQAAGEISTAEEGACAFAGGIAFPHTTAARRWLAGTASNDNLVGALAVQARQRFCADVGVAIGTYPTSVELQQSAQTFEFFFAVADEHGLQLVQRAMSGHPDVLGPRAAKTGLDLVRRRLGGIA
jgi:nicotinamide-nucleotide amidase